MPPTFHAGSPASTVSTLAGSGSRAFVDGTGTDASFDYSFDVALSPDGTILFVADTYNHRIRQIVIATAVVTTLAGSGTATFADGTGGAASFNYPRCIAVSPDGTLLFVGDANNHRIRQIVIATGVVTTLAGSGSATFADGDGTAASFYHPHGVVVSPDGAYLFVADTSNDRIRQIVIATGVVSTLVGSGLNVVQFLTISHDGTVLYFSDRDVHRILQVAIATAVVSTLAGSGSGTFADGTGTAASFKYPYGIDISPDGTLLFVADDGNRRIRQIVIATGVVSTLAGSGSTGFVNGDASAAQFGAVRGIAASLDGSTLYVAAYENQRIRQVHA